MDRTGEYMDRLIQFQTACGLTPRSSRGAALRLLDKIVDISVVSEGFRGPTLSRRLHDFERPVSGIRTGPPGGLAHMCNLTTNTR